MDHCRQLCLLTQKQRCVIYILKSLSFLKKNKVIPFLAKLKVFDDALMSSVLYECEAWFNGDLKPVDKLYNWVVKQLLGVCMTTRTNTTCYVELGFPPLKYLVISKQCKFFRRLWQERQCMMDPWAHVVKLVLTTV